MARSFMRCKDCGHRTPIDAKGAWYDPGGPFAESDEYSEPSLVCPRCALIELELIENAITLMEAQYAAEAERQDEWERIGKWAEAMEL